MTLLNDVQIAALAYEGMIQPFTPNLIRQVDNQRVISFGLSSYGYDLTLSPAQFRIFRHRPGSVVNPKAFDPAHLEDAPLHEDEHGRFFIAPGNSYGLGVAAEHLSLPPNVTALFIGKSTYARCGLIANLTPGEAGWKGHLTLEFSNSSSADIRIYAGEGIVQALFFQGEPCSTCYDTRAGKYQGQGLEIVTARV